ncbi:hypothetical protein ACYFX5_05135 [Bremerella sp. T1]|uniref:hypothetical protein n=1 Tax=Bremerella sp. TYQ1 TaxID=3119568 RepID=UPI001CCAB0E9|nr:hypothetical protein [Bremerella volcania]UBM37647.1 hypothetical protein LA756_07090 [Bremerella volcania]
MTSHEIEFLPKKYREKRKRDTSHISRLLLLVVVAAGMSVMLLYQLASLHSVNHQLAEVEEHHERVSKLMQEVELKRIEVAQKRHHANLLTFLDHPFPKSQVIATIANPLPVEITITRIQLATPISQVKNSRPATEKGKAAPQGHPMELDLKQLLGETSQRRCVIELEGTTDDTSCLYTFLAELHQADIVESAKIESIDPQVKADGREFSNFTAHIKIKRGHLAHFETIVSQAISTLNDTEEVR